MEENMVTEDDSLEVGLNFSDERTAVFLINKQHNECYQQNTEEHVECEPELAIGSEVNKYLNKRTSITEDDPLEVEPNFSDEIAAFNLIRKEQNKCNEQNVEEYVECEPELVTGSEECRYLNKSTSITLNNTKCLVKWEVSSNDENYDEELTLFNDAELSNKEIQYSRIQNIIQNAKG